MRYLTATLIAFGLSASPALAQERAAASERPQMCKMMHNGKEMQGMMVKGEDGKTTCQMVDHASSDHSRMDHSDHSSMGHSRGDRSAMDHSSMDHSAMGHGDKHDDARETAEEDRPQAGHEHH